MDYDMLNAAGIVEVEDQEIDKRVYSTRRLRSYHGYEDAAEETIDDGLAFRLHPIWSYHSRVI